MDFFGIQGRERIQEEGWLLGEILGGAISPSEANVGSHTVTPNKAISQKNNGHILTPVSAIENGHILTLHWPVQKKMVKAALISNFTQQNQRLVAAR